MLFVEPLPSAHDIGFVQIRGGCDLARRRSPTELHEEAVGPRSQPEVVLVHTHTISEHEPSCHEDRTVGDPPVLGRLPVRRASASKISLSPTGPWRYGRAGAACSAPERLEGSCQPLRLDAKRRVEVVAIFEHLERKVGEDGATPGFSHIRIAHATPGSSRFSVRWRIRAVDETARGEDQLSAAWLSARAARSSPVAFERMIAAAS